MIILLFLLLSLFNYRILLKIMDLDLRLPIVLCKLLQDLCIAHAFTHVADSIQQTDVLVELVRVLGADGH